MKHSLLLLIGILALCMVAVNGISKEDEQKLIKICTDRCETYAKCREGVSKLKKVSLV